MNEIQFFTNPDCGTIRITVIDNEPWFIAADVCNALEIQNSRDALTRLDDDEKDVVLTDTPGGKQKMAAVNESGLYNLVLGSRKPEAKTFKRWITHDVIPSIRKTGSYSRINRENLSPQMQSLYGLLDNMAAIEIEQKKQAEHLTAIETKVETMKEVFMEPIGDWRKDINLRIKKIAQAVNRDYKDIYNEMYGQLEVKAKVILSRRCESKKKRMEKAGNTKAAITEATTKIAIIYDDIKLRTIFEEIVKLWTMRFCA